jgi:hypothetical protein
LPHINENLADVTDGFVKRGGKHLLIDEVHKFKNWSLEIIPNANLNQSWYNADK